jgi:hypothetical protein
MLEDLRRIARVSVCCRVAVRDRYGLWTAVTDDLCDRGCQIVTQRLLRPGTTLHLTLSSDLFPEELHVIGRTVWSAADRLGVVFEASGDRAGVTPQQFLEWVLENGEMPDSTGSCRLVPSVQRLDGARPAISTTARNGRLVRTVQSESEPLRPVRRA